MRTRILLLAGALAGAALAGCSPAANQAATANGSANAAMPAAADHEAAIRAITERWLELVRNRDAAGIAQLYSEDGAVLPPNAPAGIGRPAIEQVWRDMMAAPGIELTFAAEQIVVASGGDMALDRGTYRLAYDGPNGRVTDTGKYVVVWRNVAGEWKAAADIFNSDLPAA